VNGQLFNDWLSVVEDIGSEEEFFFDQGIPFMGSLKVLSQFRDGDVEIEITGLVEDSSDQMDDKTVCGILIWSKLDFHCSELDSPANLIVNGNFKSDRVPIGSVQHLKQGEFLVGHVSEIFMHYQNVTFHDIGHMIDKKFVDLDVKFFSCG
jgi:hypothetical protein